MTRTTIFAFAHLLERSSLAANRQHRHRQVFADLIERLDHQRLIPREEGIASVQPVAISVSTRQLDLPVRASRERARRWLASRGLAARFVGLSLKRLVIVDRHAARRRGRLHATLRLLHDMRELVPEQLSALVRVGLPLPGAKWMSLPRV